MESIRPAQVNFSLNLKNWRQVKRRQRQAGLSRRDQESYLETELSLQEIHQTENQNDDKNHFSVKMY